MTGPRIAAFTAFSTLTKGFELYRDLFDISDPQLGHDSDADNHDQQHSKPTKPVQAIRCNSLSPSWPNSHGVAGGKILAFPCRSASAKPESPPAMRSDFVLTPRPHTSPAQAEVTCPPQQRCASPAIDALQSRRVAARDDKFPSFSNADSLKEVFDMDRGSRSPRTPTQLRRSISMRPTIGHEAPSRPNSASPYTAHIESQLRHLEKHCHGLQAQVCPLLWPQLASAAGTFNMPCHWQGQSMLSPAILDHVGCGRDTWPIVHASVMHSCLLSCQPHPAGCCCHLGFRLQCWVNAAPINHK